MGKLQQLSRLDHRSVEWIVVIDDPSEIPSVDAHADVLIIRSPMRGGTSAARNYALASSTGTWVMPLDHDDLVDASGLLHALHEPKATKYDWFVGQAVNVGGSRDQKRVRNPGAVWAPRQLEETWQCPLQFHPNIIIARRDLALSVGGWPAISGVQDLVFLMFLNRHAAGTEVDHCFTHIRRWDMQTTSQAYWLDVKKQDFHLLGAIINAERSQHGLAPVSVPDPIRARAETQYGGLFPQTPSPLSLG
ncbi:MAG: glycosyltransferase family 2 protein [Candidatus Dormibacteria bacterium]